MTYEDGCRGGVGAAQASIAGETVGEDAGVQIREHGSGGTPADRCQV
jgi:hypothetical protein